MGILEKLIIISLLLFPLGELVRIEILKNTIFHPIDISIFLLSAYWIYLQIKNKKNILKAKVAKPIMIFAAVALISLLVNLSWLKTNEFITSIMYLGRWLVFASIYFAIKDTKLNFKKNILTKLMILIGLIILTAGFLQFFFFPDLISLYKYGWDKHMHRMFSVFLDPNFAGAFFVLYLLFIASKIFNNLNNKKYKLMLLYSIIASLTLIAIYMTYSRSALLMLLVSTTVFFFLIRLKRLILIMIALTILYIYIVSPNFYIENTNLLRVNSSIERVKTAEIAIQIIKENPIFGIGFNAYRYALEKYNFRSEKTLYPSHADAGTDNSFLFVLATSGIVGLLAYLSIFFLLFKKIYRQAKDGKNILAAAVFSSGIGLCLNAQFINSLFFWPIMFWMWIMLAITDSEDKEIKNLKN
jgi:putative inorganic carbon (HCO3(-)) transporter